MLLLISSQYVSPIHEGVPVHPPVVVGFVAVLIPDPAIPVVEFSMKGYKIINIFG
jgi:hypothetical protein